MTDKRKILIVDDDQDAIIYYTTILEEGGFDFITAMNGEEGLEKVQEEKPDIILLDLMMPKKSGIGFFNEVKEKEEFRDIPIIMISGASKATGVDMKSYILQRPFHERKVQVTGREVETKPVEFLDKPVEPDVLIKTVNRVLSQDGERRCGMAKITEHINIEYVKEFLQYGEKIAKMVATLETKGKALATEIGTLEELEGKSERKGDKCILKKCPMVPVLEEIKKANEDLTGVRALPNFYAQIVEEYVNLHSGEESILHPLCIAHQVIRKTFAKLKGMHIQQIACRSGESGKVVYSKNGLEKGGLSEEQALEMLGDNACLYQLSN